MTELTLLIAFGILTLIALTMATYPLRLSLLKTIFLVLLFLGLIIGAYWYWGSWTQWSQFLIVKAKQEQVQAVLKSVKNPQELIDKLKLRLERDPHSAQGWYLLGRLYASQGEWSLAVSAYEKAHDLKPSNDQITVNYAQSLWQSNGRHFNVKVLGLFQALIAKDPKQPDALAMLAIHAFERKDYSKAINYWRRLIILVPPESEDAEAIRQAIINAKDLERGR